MTPLYHITSITVNDGMAEVKGYQAEIKAWKPLKITVPTEQLVYEEYKKRKVKAGHYAYYDPSKPKPFSVCKRIVISCPL